MIEMVQISSNADAGREGAQGFGSVGFATHNLTQHALSAAFPAMPLEDLTALQLDIETFGQRDPITVFEGQVLDGWNRYGCLTRLGVAVKQVELPAGADPVAFVKSRNLHRRHMKASQRALAVVACSEWQSTGRPGKVAPGATFTNKQLAAESDTSTRTIRHAKTVVDKATPEVVEAVKSGDMSLKAAVETTKPTVATPIPAPAPGPVTVLKPVNPPKLSPAPSPALTPAPSPDLAPATTLQQQYDELLERFNQVAADQKETLADNNKMGAIFDADDKLKAAMDRIAQLEALVDVMQVRNDGLMSEKNEAIAAAKRWKRKAEGK